MSEARKSQHGTREAREGVQQAKEAAHSAADSATRGARETFGRAEDVFDQNADDVRDIGVSVADTVARTADVALEITERVAEQGRDAMWRGLFAAAGVNGRLADVGYGRSHRVLEQSARTLELYREAGEATAEHMQALFASGLSLTRGIQEMQLVALRMFDNAAERGTHKPRDLLRCKSMTDLAEMQRDVCMDSVNYAIEASSTLLQIAGRVAQDAMRPLQGRAAART